MGYDKCICMYFRIFIEYSTAIDGSKKYERFVKQKMHRIKSV